MKNVKKKSEFFIYNKHCFHAFPQGKHKQTFPGSFSKERVLYATLRSFITGEICFVCAADWTNDIFKEWILSFALLLMFGISWNYIHYCDIKNQFVILNGNQERYYSNTWLTRAFEPRCKFIELLLVHIQAFYDIHRAVSVNESWGEFLSDQGAHSNASHQVPFNAAVNKTKEKNKSKTARVWFVRSDLLASTLTWVVWCFCGYLALSCSRNILFVVPLWISILELKKLHCRQLNLL